MHFQIYFKTPSLLAFFKLWLTLFRNMQNKEYNYQGAEREKRKRKRTTTTKIKVNSKTEFG